jgi:serine phosphatase RsbU (regulator of sigma subunit)
MLATSQYEVLEKRLAPGDRILLFSDGLSEAENADGEFFEKTALPRVIRENPRSDCEELRAVLERAVTDFIESDVPADDVTIVVIEYAG